MTTNATNANNLQTSTICTDVTHAKDCFATSALRGRASGAAFASVEVARISTKASNAAPAITLFVTPVWHLSANATLCAAESVSTAKHAAVSFAVEHSARTALITDASRAMRLSAHIA